MAQLIRFCGENAVINFRDEIGTIHSHSMLLRCPGRAVPAPVG